MNDPSTPAPISPAPTSPGQKLNHDPEPIRYSIKSLLLFMLMIGVYLAGGRAWFWLRGALGENQVGQTAWFSFGTVFIWAVGYLGVTEVMPLIFRNRWTSRIANWVRNPFVMLMVMAAAALHISLQFRLDHFEAIPHTLLAFMAAFLAVAPFVRMRFRLDDQLAGLE